MKKKEAINALIVAVIFGLWLSIDHIKDMGITFPIKMIVFMIALLGVGMILKGLTEKD